MHVSTILNFTGQRLVLRSDDGREWTFDPEPGEPPAATLELTPGSDAFPLARVVKKPLTGGNLLPPSRGVVLVVDRAVFEAASGRRDLAYADPDTAHRSESGEIEAFRWLVVR